GHSKGTHPLRTLTRKKQRRLCPSGLREPGIEVGIGLLELRKHLATHLATYRTMGHSPN
ncbi:unnamed protein product, partial [Gadus morhua 'NCC']